MSDGLKVIIGADVTQGINGVKLFNAELAKTTKAGAGVQQAITKTATSLNAIRPASNTAGQALLNLGRIAQDAPFGFIGISNNINPLLESFQRLRAESGSTSGALKSLASGFIGGAGIGLAVSVATGLLTVFADRLFKTKTTTDAAAVSAKKYADAQRDSAENLQKQVLEVESLVRIARSDVSTKEEQRLALSRLNEIIPDNIGKVDALNIKTNEGISIIREYTDALEDQATAELLRGRAAEIRVKQFDAERTFTKTISDSYKGLVGLQNDLTKAQRKKSDFVSQQTIDEVLTAERAIEVAFQKMDKVTKEHQRSLSQSARELAELRIEIDDNTRGALGTIAPPPKKLDKEKDPLAIRIQQLEDLRKITKLFHSEEFELRDLKVQLATRDAIKNGLGAGQLQREIDEITRIEKPKITVGLAVDSSQVSIDEFGKQVRIINTSLAALGKPLEGGDATITRVFDAALDRAETLATFISSTLQPVFSAVFETIASGGTNALKAFGDALKALVAKLVSAAITAAIFAAIMTIASGGASGVFAGQFTKMFSALSGLPKFAEGGIVQGPMNAIIGEKGPEAVIPLRDLNRVLGSIGGAGGREVFIVENRLEGDIIVQAYRRASNRYGGTFT